MSEPTAICPLADRVLVEPCKAQEKTPGGLYLPAQAQEAPLRGTVLAIGPGRLVDGQVLPVAVSPGDTVLFGRYGGHDIEEGGRKLKILSESDILAKIKT